MTTSSTNLEPLSAAEAAAAIPGAVKRADESRWNARRRATAFGIEASSHPSLSGWKPSREDAFADEYQSKIYEIIARAFNLHINNADIRGHNLGRSGRVVGAGIDWKAQPVPSEIGLSVSAAKVVCDAINRKRELHSTAGGFDAAGKDRSEGILQVVAFLTHFIMGGCLIHRVWDDAPGRVIPLAIEMIPGSRISTPFNRYGDPLVHFGIEYADKYRSKVVGWHVKRVPATVGNSTVQYPEWDFISYEDGAFLELIEPAGVDRALPNCVAVTRLVFNRGQMFESTVEAARNHASHHMIIKVGKGNFYDRAADAADEITQSSSALPEGWRNVDGVKERFIDGEDEATPMNATMPGPDFVGVDGKYDERMCRGLNGRLSEFTRRMDASYSGGMQERQNDNPNVEQMRENFIDKWNRVHGWFLDACYLSNAVEMPGYSASTRVFWLQARKTPPAEIPLNPVDHANAIKLRLAMGQSDEYTESEAEGRDYEKTLANRARAAAARRQAEIEHDLPKGILEPLNDLPEIKSQPVENPDNRDNDGDRGTRAMSGGRSRISGRMKAVRV